MNASSNVQTSSTPAASSTLRPRTKRLISILDSGDEESLAPANAASARSTSPLPSPYDSRSASPIPASHLSRPRASNGPQRSTGVNPGKGTAGRQRRAGNESPTSLAGLWGNSWTAIQGIASDLLSTDDPMEDAGNGRPSRSRKPLSRLYNSRSSSKNTSSTWGPGSWNPNPTTKDIGAGTKEEQLAAFRAQKRRDMLTNQESSYADTLGKFKRRTSEDGPSASAPAGDSEVRDALVYVHHVQKSDTLAGITIKYNCTANTLRKANRMWPNDTVQSKKTILLPVDGCGVKGKVIPGPEAVDLLGSESDALSAGQAEEVPSIQASMSNGLDGNGRDRSNSATSNASLRPTSSIATSMSNEALWHHDSWVLFTGSTKPTEIARLSRRAMGYFPPTRRKSNCYSDFDTPSTSLDLSRAPASDATSHRGLSPMRQDSPQRSQRPGRPRRLSNAGTGYFPTYLNGPGGVGTMGRNVHFPGPGQDGLNKMFAKHLPDVAPPRNQQALLTPEMPLYSDDGTPILSGTSTPNVSKALNLENVGGAIETWMRKMATKAREPTDRDRAARTSVGTPGKGVGGIGDLIEMTDEFELGADEEVEEDRGRQGSDVFVGSSSTATAYAGSGVRGRMPASNAGKKHD